MRPRPYWILAALVLGVSATLAGVEVIHDENVDFTGYRTYAWREGTPAGNPQAQAWIVGAVDRELAASGLRKVEPAAADLYVVSHVAGQFDWGATGMYVYSATWDVGLLKGDASGSAKGTVIVDLVERDSNRAVWRGTAHKSLLLETPLGQVRKKIDKIVKKFFRDYPPGD